MQKLKTIDNKIRLLSKCSICDALLKTDAPAEIIFEDNLCSLLYLQCPACQSRLLGFLEEDEFLGARADLYITDLQPDEARNFLDSKSILVDDLIDLYQALKKNKIKEFIDQL